MNLYSVIGWVWLVLAMVSVFTNGTDVAFWSQIVIANVTFTAGMVVKDIKG